MSKIIEKNKNLKFLNTMRIEAIAEYYAKPKNIIELKEVVKFAEDNNLKIIVLGNGSNILFSKKRINNSIVIDMKKFNKIKLVEDNLIEIQSGVKVKDFLNFCLKNQLSGIEFLAGIPATIGGIVKMNAGAFGETVAEVIERIFGLDIKNKNEISLRNVKFLYRKTIGLEDKIITKVIFKLKKDSRENIKFKIKKFVEKRKKSQPSGYSLGSIFKNPKNNFAGKLIEDCGLKGVSVNDALVSNKHANFILNKNKATGEDVLKLITLIKNNVFQKKKIKLEEEIVII